MDATTEYMPDRPLVSIGLNDTVNVHRRPHFREAARLAEARLATLLTQAGFFDGAPFSWVMVSAGLDKETQTPRLGRVDKKYGGLDIWIAIDGIASKRSTAEAVADLFVRDCLLALLRAADRHDRPREVISSELARMTEGVEVNDAEDEAPPDDELHIRLALSDDGFGDPSELPLLHEVADAIHDALRQQGCGGVEGTEVGLGSFLIFCIEGDPSEMLRIVRPVVARYALRPGAAAVLIVGGDEQPPTPLN